MLAPVGKCRVPQGNEGQQGASCGPVGECRPPEVGHGAVTVRMHPCRLGTKHRACIIALALLGILQMACDTVKVLEGCNRHNYVMRLSGQERFQGWFGAGGPAAAQHLRAQLAGYPGCRWAAARERGAHGASQGKVAPGKLRAAKLRFTLTKGWEMNMCSLHARQETCFFLIHDF